MPSRHSRVFVLCLDGAPWSLVARFVEEGIMPHLAELLRQGGLVQIDSVCPTVSNVAWACFPTGKNPGKFDIFGFAEVGRDLQLRLPNSLDLRSATLQELASRPSGRANGASPSGQVISLGLPCSYPPRPINGVMVGGFLAPSLEKAVYPPRWAAPLRKAGYQLDIDPVRAGADRALLKRQLVDGLDGRRRAAEVLMAAFPWQLTLLHVMETDRINHFLWKAWQDGEEADFFEGFYRWLDELIGWLAGTGDLDELIILSDHGFCAVQREVQLNRWLMQEGYLRLSGKADKETLAAISADSLAFALVPGRIHLLREEVYGRGGVTAGNEREVRDELMAKLRGLSDPKTHRPICRRVFRRDELYHGPYLARAPDIAIDPHDGFDLKASLGEGTVFTRGPMTGMHTRTDAMFYARGRSLVEERRCITDATRSVLERLQGRLPTCRWQAGEPRRAGSLEDLEALGVEVPDELDSRGMFRTEPQGSSPSRRDEASPPGRGNPCDW